jgi:hypothetical protein
MNTLKKELKELLKKSYITNKNKLKDNIRKN